MPSSGDVYFVVNITKVKDLREELACFARKIAKDILDPTTLEPYTACRLIPLDKAPGEKELQIRPIGVGEVLRRIVGKTIAWAHSEDMQEAAGSLQVSTGLKGGSEAIHAMKDLYERECTDAVILVDAENAFNKLRWHYTTFNICVHVLQQFSLTHTDYLLDCSLQVEVRLHLLRGPVLWLQHYSTDIHIATPTIASLSILASR